MRRRPVAYFFDNRVTSLPRLCEILQRHHKNVISVVDMAVVNQQIMGLLKILSK
jgi:hypothetical protein